MSNIPAPFAQIVQNLPGLVPDGRLAVAVSGGPDSMALLWLAARAAERGGFEIYAYTVDHGLRAESAAEAETVQGWIKNWPGVRHKILRWAGDKPGARVLEEARAARYDLIAVAMAVDEISTLAVGHHRDDQAETFLFRLAKGSGLDGLAGMLPAQKRKDIILLRPLLEVSKEDLVALCEAKDIPFVRDPTNENEDYMRPRLRAAREVLEQEGLSAKRLSLTARRIGRARAALESLAEELRLRALTEKREDGFLFDFNILRAAPEELVLRVVLASMEEIHPGEEYGPRLERAEALTARILYEEDFKGATLGGCIFAKDLRHATLWVGKER